MEYLYYREKQLVGHKGNFKRKIAPERGLLPISRSSLWQRVKSGTFPKPIKLSSRTTVWRKSDVDEWIKSCEENSGRG